MESLIDFFLATTRRERRGTLELRASHEVLRAQYRDLEERYSELQSVMEEQKSINTSIMRRLELLENK